MVPRRSLPLNLLRADQNTGGALLEFPVRTAMHGKFRVSSAISTIFKVGRPWELYN